MSTTNSAAGPTAPALLQGGGSASAESASSPVGGVRRWTITTTDGRKYSGPLGSWAEEDPSETGVPPGSLARRLEDLTLWAAFPGTSIAVQSKAFEDWETPVEHPVMRASLDCYPYEEDPARRVPLLNIELAPECAVIDLDPARLAAFLTAMRAQLDLLEQVAGKALVEAREEWERIREDRQPEPVAKLPCVQGR